MDVQSAQGNPEDEAPRHLFFGCEDRRLGGRAGLDEKHLTIERSRRLQLASHVENTATQLVNAVRALRAYDRTGDALDALPHLLHTFQDLQKYTTNLADEVNKSMDRYGDNIDLLALRDAALATAAMKTPTAAVEPSPQQAPAAVGPNADKEPRVTPLTLVQNTAFSIISAGLDEAQRSRANLR